MPRWPWSPMRLGVPFKVLGVPIRSPLGHYERIFRRPLHASESAALNAHVAGNDVQGVPAGNVRGREQAKKNRRRAENQLAGDLVIERACKQDKGEKPPKARFQPMETGLAGARAYSTVMVSSVW